MITRARPPGQAITSASLASLLSERQGAVLLAESLVRVTCRRATCSEPHPSSTPATIRPPSRLPSSTCSVESWFLTRKRRACRRCCEGFLLEGFPRTMAQAEALDRILTAEHVSLDAVLDYQLSLEQLVARPGGRWFSRSCEAVFHLQARPAGEGRTTGAGGGWSGARTIGRMPCGSGWRPTSTTPPPSPNTTAAGASSKSCLRRVRPRRSRAEPPVSRLIPLPARQQSEATLGHGPLPRWMASGAAAR